MHLRLKVLQCIESNVISIFKAFTNYQVDQELMVDFKVKDWHFSAMPLAYKIRDSIVGLNMATDCIV